MKLNDYFRLSKISLKARKKTTKSTVRGISFGLILLMPLLFIIIAFHIDLNKEVDKDAAIRTFNIGFTNETTEEDYAQLMLEKYEEEILSLDGIENSLKYNYYSFYSSRTDYIDDVFTYIPLFSLKIDDKTFELNYGFGEYSNEQVKTNYVGITAIDTAHNKNIFLKSDYEMLGGDNPLVAGKTLSNETSEIMVSSDLLKHYNLSAEEVLGKKISISYKLISTGNVTTSKTIISSEGVQKYQEYPVAILNDYTIVGIFDGKITKSSTRISMANQNFSSNGTVNNDYFWINKKSLYDSAGNSYIPKNVKYEQEMPDGYKYINYAYYYEQDLLKLAKESNNNNCVFIPFGMGASEKIYNAIEANYNTIIEFVTYNYANKASSTIDALYKKTSTSTDTVSSSSEYMNEVFLNYQLFYNVFTYICIALAIFGGIVFFATLLNLYNTIHYSVQSRRNYIGMMRAIGIQSNDVVKLFFIEIFQIFARSYIWTIIFGGAICLGMCLGFDMIMESSYAQSVITIDLSLNPIFILVSFVILVIINLIISISFASVACHNVAKKPILSVLSENR